MKAFLVILLLLVGVLAYTMLGTKDDTGPTPTPAQQQADATWQAAIPDGTELVPDGQARIEVRPVRRNEGAKVYLDLHITEEHGYMVDGIRVEFWYRYKDDDSAAWIDDSARIDYFIRERLPLNETLVATTVLLDAEFEHLAIDLAATTSENWGARVVGYNRAMRRTP